MEFNFFVKTRRIITVIPIAPKKKRRGNCASRVFLKLSFGAFFESLSQTDSLRLNPNLEFAFENLLTNERTVNLDLDQESAFRNAVNDQIGKPFFSTNLF